MSLKNAQVALNTLTKALKFEPIHLTPDETKTFLLDDVEYYFKYDDSLDRLDLSCKIVPAIPKEEAKKIMLYELILQAQLEFGEIQIGVVGLDKTKQILFLLESLPIKEENPELLIDILPIFAQMSAAWKELLTIGSSSGMQKPLSR